MEQEKKDFMEELSKSKVEHLPPLDESPMGKANYFQINKIGDAIQDIPNPSRIRVLGSFDSGSIIAGYRAFLMNGKPMRAKSPENFDPDMLGQNDFGQDEKPRQFWAFPIWNYHTGDVQICELHQKKVMNQLKSWVDSPAWGDLRGYDVNVSKSGSGKNTAYSVTPIEIAPFPTEHQERAKTLLAVLKLEALFSNGDPFEEVPQ